MTHPDLDPLRAAATRASKRSQYRVTVSPGAVLLLFRERDRLADRVAVLEQQLAAPPARPRRPGDPDRRPRLEF